MSAAEVRTNDQPGMSAGVRNARSLLLPWAIGVTVLCVAMQLIIVARGSEIDLTAELLLGMVAVFYAGFLILRHGQLQRVRFAMLVTHGVTYLIVNGSFQLHAAVLAMSNSDKLRGDVDFPMDAGWFGMTLAMTGFWAIGLAVHAFVSISQRGFEN